MGILKPLSHSDIWTIILVNVFRTSSIKDLNCYAILLEIGRRTVQMSTLRIIKNQNKWWSKRERSSETTFASSFTALISFETCLVVLWHSKCMINIIWFFHIDNVERIRLGRMFIVTWSNWLNFLFHEISIMLSNLTMIDLNKEKFYPCLKYFDFKQSAFIYNCSLIQIVTQISWLGSISVISTPHYNHYVRPEELVKMIQYRIHILIFRLESNH